MRKSGRPVSRSLRCSLDEILIQEDILQKVLLFCSPLYMESNKQLHDLDMTVLNFELVLDN